MALDSFEKKIEVTVSLSNLIGFIVISVFISNTSAIPTIPGPCMPCKCMMHIRRLKIVNCSHLGLEAIPTGLPTDIHILDLSFNQLKQYKLTALQNFKSVKYLNLAYNNIDIIFSKDFANLTFLQEIDLTGNLLMGIGKKTFENLGERLRGIRGIEAIHFQKDVFENLDKLKELSIVFYQSFIPIGIFDPLTGLQNLFLTVMNATTLPVGLFNFESNSLLKTLKIEARNLILIPGTILRGLSELSSFTIIAKRLVELPGEMFHGGGTVQKENGGVKNHNHNVVNLGEVTIKGVKRLPADLFQKQNKVRKIDLTGISKIEKGLFDDLTTLVHLDISDCTIGNISDIWFPGCVSLRTLNLSHAQLISIYPSAFRGLTSLVKLDISNNNITNINRDILSSLKHSLTVLNISRNSLEALTPDMLLDMSKLELLDISYNEISILPNTFLENVVILKSLFVQGNRISKIPDSFLATQYDLLEIDFSDNNITEIPTGLFFHAISIQKVIIDKNPLDCGCPIAEILIYSNLEIVGSCLQSNRRNGTDVLLNLNDLRFNKSCLREKYTTSPETTSTIEYSTHVPPDFGATTLTLQQSTPFSNTSDKVTTNYTNRGTGKPDGPQLMAEVNTTSIVDTIEFFIATTTGAIITLVLLAWIGVYFGRHYMRKKTYYTSGPRSGLQRSTYR